MEHPLISVQPGVMGGKPCIKGSRVPVDVVLDYLAVGQSVADVLAGYPDLTEADILAAIAFAADHVRTNGFVAV